MYDDEPEYEYNGEYDALGDDAPPNVWIVVPAFNEAQNLTVVIPRVVAALAKVSVAGTVLIIDDGSTDNTSTVLQKLSSEHPQVEFWQQRVNQGKAAALHKGFTIALEHSASIIVMMDADGQDEPNELPRLIEQINAGFDVVTGARTKNRQDRFVKKYTSRLYNAVTRRMSGTPGTDFNSGFKALSAGATQAILPMLYGEMHRYITVLAHWNGYRITEVPVTHHRRLFGETKYGIARFWRGFLDLMTVRFLMSYQSRPSHLFGGLGVLSTLVGGLALGYLLVLRLMGETVGDRPLLLAGLLFVIVGVQLFLFGLLAELIVYGRNNHRRQ